MFYEEKLIDGIMYCRTRPDGDWEQMSIEKLSREYARLKQLETDVKVYVESQAGLLEMSSRLIGG